MNPEPKIRYASEKDPETLEREINQTRAEMNQTLDSLERKLTAGQLLDQSLKFFGMKGTEIGSSLGRCMKENPMPFFLTATGIGWMMFGPSQSGSARPDRRSHGYSAYGYEEDEENERAVTDRAGEAISKVGDKLQSGVSATRERFVESAESAKDAAHRTASSVKEGMSRATESVRGGMNRTANIAQSQARQARDTFNSLLEEQPLILGAIGLAIGAIIGAALPSTEQEDRLVGELSDKTLTKGKEIGARVYEKGSQIAKNNIEKVFPAVAGESSQHDNGIDELER
jgi:ElaB/YqjD/DUF883 family membrane-anchored ribosome-binding protein